ncbi:MAG: transposase [Solirubrobacterales bacterium]|nr:transposase [Solirubrobacterales bacterium]
MGQNFIACDPEADGVDAARLDGLGAGRSPRDDGRGLLYAYARGNRSSRGIERECREDVIYKLVSARRVPDHSTIAEFVAGMSGRSASCSPRCWRCATRPVVEVGVISIDGMKIRTNASRGREPHL